MNKMNVLVKKNDLGLIYAWPKKKREWIDPNLIMFKYVRTWKSNKKKSYQKIRSQETQKRKENPDHNAGIPTSINL